jgi:hypothetical protein
MMVWIPLFMVILPGFATSWRLLHVPVAAGGVTVNVFVHAGDVAHQTLQVAVYDPAGRLLKLPFAVFDSRSAHAVFVRNTLKFVEFAH